MDLREHNIPAAVTEVTRYMTIKVVGRDIVTLQIFCYCVFHSSELMDFPAIKSSSEGPGVVAN